jgi:hypothetical protein
MNKEMEKRFVTQLERLADAIEYELDYVPVALVEQVLNARSLLEDYEENGG